LVCCCRGGRREPPIGNWSVMHVAVAIVGYRNAGDIVGCLRALSASTHSDFEVVVCENGGSEAFQALTAAVPEALAGGQRVSLSLAEHNLGFAGGVNACIAAARDADAWWLLNPDTEPAPGALTAMVERLSRGDCEASGCTIVLPSGVIQSYGGVWRPWLARSELIGHGDTLGDPIDQRAVELNQSYLSGASMLVGRRFLDVVGLMREDYFLYCEEVEWCLRGVAAGMRLGFAVDARVVHLHGTTTGAGGAMRDRPRMPIYLDERNKMLLTQDCFRERFAVAALAALAQLVLRCLRDRAWRHFGFGVAGWLAGLSGERGVPGWMQSTV
jgi:N-acetylglucosaminyl-diphospho-decaprenol L-rhamnosyltransferase